MSEKRWQPPPMAGAQKDGAPTPKVDEKVVRKMLQVNPGMRQGRSTMQVKKALEQGAAISVQDGASAAAPAATGKDARPHAAGVAGELDDAMGFFLRGKAEAFRAALGDLLARRRALDEEEARTKKQLRDQIGGFVSLLDAKAVEAHGAAALAKHGELMRLLGVTPAELLDAARRGRK
jgi:hypothetical protein